MLAFYLEALGLSDLQIFWADDKMSLKYISSDHFSFFSSFWKTLNEIIKSQISVYNTPKDSTI